MNKNKAVINYYIEECRDCSLSFMVTGKTFPNSDSTLVKILCPLCKKHINTINHDELEPPQFYDVKKCDKSVKEVRFDILNIVNDIYRLDDETNNSYMQILNATNLFHLAEKILMKDTCEWSNQSTLNIYTMIFKYGLNKIEGTTKKLKEHIENKYNKKIIRAFRFFIKKEQTHNFREIEIEYLKNAQNDLMEQLDEILEEKNFVDYLSNKYSRKQ